MVDDVPGVFVRPSGESDSPSLDADTIEEFKSMVEDAWNMIRKKKGLSKEKKRAENEQKLRAMTDQFKRAQRYLGLRPTIAEGTCQLHQQAIAMLWAKRRPDTRRQDYHADFEHRTIRHWSAVGN